MYVCMFSIPWYALAIADLSSWLDISGTMINACLVLTLGFRGMNLYIYIYIYVYKYHFINIIKFSIFLI